MKKFDIAIIGGGILGTSISYWLSILYDLNICVIEKESKVAMHTSSRNTGVVHSPFYMDPTKRKALSKSALLSRELWKTLASKYDLPWKETGTIEVALDSQQNKVLEKYLKWGVENGIPENELSLLNSSEISKKEPNLQCHSGLYCSSDVSTDFGLFTTQLQKESQASGITFLLKHQVDTINENSDGVLLELSNSDTINSKFVINCAGGNSLDIAQKFGLAQNYNDLHFRGEYWIADKQYADLTKTNIYSVAKFSEYPFLDPHWIKRANGDTEIGPNAVPVLTPETYSGYIDDLQKTTSKIFEMFTGNARKLFLNSEFLSLISHELLSSVSKSAMVDRVKQFIPKIRPEYFTKRGTSGIRSPIITSDGKFLPDVLELSGNNSFHIINYNSPGATGAPAYSAFIIKKLQNEGFLKPYENHKKSFWNFDSITNQA